MSEALPVTIIGGYLGAGKTTMVNHLLRTANGQRLAILVNEFGELPIDEDLIEAQDEDIISIAGGCVCCSFGSDLTGALLEMAQLKPRPDHLIIESSGVAIPSAIAGSISLLEAYRVDGIVVLADAETVQQSATDKYMSDTVMRQITDANILILNKTDLVAEGALAQTFDWLKAQNPGVRVVTAQQGVVAPQIVLGSFLERAAQPGPFHHTENMEMHTLAVPAPMDAHALAQRLAETGAGLVRAKGFVTSHCGQKQLIQVVGNRWAVSDAPDDRADGIVCLGFRGQIADWITKGRLDALLSS